MNRSIVVLGGAGFIGSRIVSYFVKARDRVTVLDGIVQGTGGRLDNLQEVIPDINFITSRIESTPGLSQLLRNVDVIVDCMAWTSHHGAMKDPFQDLELNVESHLHVLTNIPANSVSKIVYLGSRGQYGRPDFSKITENTAMIPEDVQGIHKVAAESYYRVFSKARGLNVVSLRLGNCFGPHQPREGSDIGLIGGFIRNLLAGKTVEVFGRFRKRHLVYVDDVAEVVFRLSEKDFPSFLAFNLAGQGVLLEELAAMLIDLIGRGSFRFAEMPQNVAEIDVGNAEFKDDRLRSYLGELPNTDIHKALGATIDYFQRGNKCDT